MRIFLIGATGNIGGCIREEALTRGHEVTGMTRDAGKLAPRDNLEVFEGDVMDRHAMAMAMAEHDVIVVAHNVPPSDPKIGIKTNLAADAIIDAMRDAGVTRVFWVGGAGSLFTKDGLRLIDAMEMPDWANAAIWAMAAHLMYLKTIEDLDWTFLSPAEGIDSGERTGNFRLGLDEVIVDDMGKSFISYQDFAVATLDELEDPRHIRQRFTVGY